MNTSFTKGRALHLVNHTTQIVERGSLVFVRPQDEHCYDYYQLQDFEFYNLGVRQEDFARVNALYHGELDSLTQAALPKQVKLSPSQLDFLEQHIISLQNTTDALEHQRLSAFLLSAVIYLIVTGENNATPEGLPDWLVSVIAEMERPENFIAGLPTLLKLSNYSQEHVNRTFRRCLGITPTQYINQLRIQYANELLTTTQLDIVEISQQCGFNSLSHFYSLFKESFGHTPHKARRSSR